MSFTARRWLGRVPTSDPFERRTAIAVQVFCIGLSVLLLLSETIPRLKNPGSAELQPPFNLLADFLALAVSVAAVVLIRRGRFRTGYAVVLGGYVAILSTSLALRGLEFHLHLLPRVFAVLLVLPALLLGRRALWTTLGVLLVAMLTGHLRDLGMLGGHGPLRPLEPALGVWGQAIAVMVLLCLMLDRFGAALAEAYATALRRQLEAERVSSELRAAKESLESEMTRRMIAESMLLQSQKLEAIGRLSGGVAHDFNNLLTAILGFAELTRGLCPPGDPRRRHVESVILAAQRGAGLSRQLLAFARRQIVQPRAVRIEEHIRAVEPMLRQLIGENVNLEFALDPNPGAVMIDPTQLEQVLMNLAVNARDAMPRGGTLRIATGRRVVAPESAPGTTELKPGEHVGLLVSDTGEGMTPETLANIFEPFFTTKEVGKGSGLGLATCYGIVRQAGGTITATSTPGHGATFEILLPVTGEVPEVEADVVPQVVPEGSEVILVVEDDPHVLDLVERVLRSHGFTVLMATGAEEAVALVMARNDALDLVLTDVVLPGRDGRSLAETLRGMRPGLVPLFMSGHSRDIIDHHGALEPGIELLSKPFTPDQLLAKVRAVLDTRRVSA
jgi:signal transduction histidine kinase/ActR/RegA family two-component response regulator